MALSEIYNILLRRQTNYFGHIEGLRALTALRVMLHHLAVFGVLFFEPSQYAQMLNHPFFKLASSTSLLLDMFFIISGFVISYSLIKRYKKSGSIDLYGFLARRCARIYPLYFLVIILCALLGMENLQTVWANILQINNFLSVQQQFIPWTWSVAVDFQFYLLFSLVLWFVAKRWIGKKTCTILVLSLILLPIILIPVLIAKHHFYYLTESVYVINQPDAWTFFNVGFDKIYVRIPAILSGIIAAYFLVYYQEAIHAHIQNKSKLKINIFALLLLAGIALLLINDPIWFFNKQQQLWQTSSYWVMLIQHLIFASIMCPLLLLADAPRGAVISSIVRLLRSAVLRPFGRISYSTYMIHPIVFMMGYAIYFATHSSITAAMYFQYGLILIAITYLIAIPLYLFVELPGMQKIRLKISPHQAKAGAVDEELPSH